MAPTIITPDTTIDASASGAKIIAIITSIIQSPLTQQRPLQSPHIPQSLTIHNQLGR
jgi:hypothetical protein